MRLREAAVLSSPSPAHSIHIPRCTRLSRAKRACSTYTSHQVLHSADVDVASEDDVWSSQGPMQAGCCCVIHVPPGCVYAHPVRVRPLMSTL